MTNPTRTCLLDEATRRAIRFSLASPFGDFIRNQPAPFLADCIQDRVRLEFRRLSSTVGDRQPRIDHRA